MRSSVKKSPTHRGAGSHRTGRRRKPNLSRRWSAAFVSFSSFFAAVGFQEVELLRAVGEGGEGDAEEADFAFDVTVVPEEIEEDGEDIGVELRGLGKRFGTGVGFEAGVTDGER